MKTKTRLLWIDFAKGLTILLVITGHTITNDYLRGLIFSFHMPLFFILSCVTYKFSTNFQEFKAKAQKAFHHLIIPAFIIFIIMFLYNFVIELSHFGVSTHMPAFFTKELLTIFFCSGSSRIPGSFPVAVPSLGIPWFLVVLFLSRTLFDYLHLTLSHIRLMLISFLISIFGVTIGHFFWLPLSLDIVFAIMPFFCFAIYFKEFNLKTSSFQKFLLYFCIWILLFIVIFSVSHNYLQLAPRQYPLFPLCYIDALFGTLMVCEFSSIFCEFNLAKPLLFLGKNSLYMLMIHSLDHILFIKLWAITSHQSLNCIMRIFVDTILFCLFMFGSKKIKNRCSQKLS